MSHTISVGSSTRSFPIAHLSNFAGLISQVAEDLWEVKGRTVTNLTKQDITIVDYKKALAKRSKRAQAPLDSQLMSLRSSAN